MDNAVDFGADDGEIDIGVGIVNGHAVATVANRGSRLPETMTERLFDPMVSVGSKDATRSHLGLGLFIARLIAEYHQGSIKAENVDTPDGVLVRLELPLASVSEAGSRATATS
ncbi:MAG: ATP-binding protein [Gammaproteobacteria bacterium]|nr:ATP-binding protein [Gammaproteobacteria bacterium]